jgi:hypothetical protein
MYLTINNFITLPYLFSEVINLSIIISIIIIITLYYSFNVSRLYNRSILERGRVGPGRDHLLYRLVFKLSAQEAYNDSPYNRSRNIYLHHSPGLDVQEMAFLERNQDKLIWFGYTIGAYNRLYLGRVRAHASPELRRTILATFPLN